VSQPGDRAPDALARLPRDRVKIVFAYSSSGKACVGGQIEKVCNVDLKLIDRPGSSRWDWLERDQVIALGLSRLRCGTRIEGSYFWRIPACSASVGTFRGT
jgi:hypothetical protein